MLQRLTGKDALSASQLSRETGVRQQALSTTQEVYAFTVFERVFKEFGLPKAIRTDNGVPFASPHALFGLSKLSVWWLRLGIQRDRRSWSRCHAGAGVRAPPRNSSVKRDLRGAPAERRRRAHAAAFR
jgi:hypothetical protein